MSNPIITIPPFADTAKLPACAVQCGALYDANGACVPPAVPTTDASVYTACFCSNNKVTAFATGSTGPCDAVCTQAGELGSIAAWYQGICSGVNGAAANNNGVKTVSSMTTSAGGAIETGTYRKNPSGGDWLSNHWKWVIMIVILVVAIAGIWIGACIWRRRYLRKKDRQYSLGQKHSGSASRPSWGPGMDVPTPEGGAPAPYDPAYNSQRTGAPGHNAAAAALAEKPAKKPKEKKKWFVTDRT